MNALCLLGYVSLVLERLALNMIRGGRGLFLVWPWASVINRIRRRFKRRVSLLFSGSIISLKVFA
ncbi:hypothetical protein AXX17_AT1G12390 [Arabidopsis thaliana]|uniref:Uncharacterized protein n=1 Tax=Arabidopsis thaliana TaxID=3702 RepID=A0A178W1V4_ARATH|nr:hypothetical protein AXX17_AT1G12390 [Arabidopsis thaliana]